jgi:hypothetical protein
LEDNMKHPEYQNMADVMFIELCGEDGITAYDVLQKRAETVIDFAADSGWLVEPATCSWQNNEHTSYCEELVLPGESLCGKHYQ